MLPGTPPKRPDLSPEFEELFDFFDIDPDEPDTDSFYDPDGLLEARSGDGSDEPVRKILAVSGGIDSMVMLHLFRNDPDVVVAHFDHGTRPSSRDDAEFVRHVAADVYRRPFYLRSVRLGPLASESICRFARYSFLSDVAERLNGIVFTAHHVDDLVESVAINLSRGTGWRGICPFSDPLVMRPFLQSEFLSDEPWDKRRIYRYAAHHRLTFRQDPTNNEPTYLRNRIRAKITESNLRPVAKSTISHEIFQLWQRQNEIRTEVNDTIEKLLPENHTCQRGWFIHLDSAVAREFLASFLAHQGIPTTRPQQRRLLHAIRTYSPGKKFNLTKGYFVLMGRDTIKVITK